MVAGGTRRRRLNIHWKFIFINIHQICIKYASNLHQICIKYASNMHQICIKKCIKYASNMHDICIRYSSSIHQKFIKYASNLHQIFIKDAQICIKFASNMHQKFIKDAQICIKFASNLHQICIKYHPMRAPTVFSDHLPPGAEAGKWFRGKPRVVVVFIHLLGCSKKWWKWLWYTWKVRENP